jgi:AcrR family transcriptional regulator
VLPGSFVDFRLPRGRHGLPSEFVAESQRWRLLGACVELVAERGCAHTTSFEIARAASVSSSTFYKHYADVSACVEAASQLAAECVAEVIAESCDPRLEWPERLRVTIEATLAFCAEEPNLVQLLGPEPQAAVAEVASERERRIAGWGEVLRRGRGGDAGSGAAAREADASLIAAAIALVVSRLRASEADRLPGLGPELTRLLQ